MPEMHQKINFKKLDVLQEISAALRSILIEYLPGIYYIWLL
jgi:hypothetical protein